ncbi:unnamed protein product [Amoebophrya sp. A120]|nr:unnamed protein product [Amoebophrya sp. A120]|eukprot:GSA120T00000823001.1
MTRSISTFLRRRQPLAAGLLFVGPSILFQPVLVHAQTTTTTTTTTSTTTLVFAKSPLTYAPNANNLLKAMTCDVTENTDAEKKYLGPCSDRRGGALSMGTLGDGMYGDVKGNLDDVYGHEKTDEDGAVIANSAWSATGDYCASLCHKLKTLGAAKAADTEGVLPASHAGLGCDAFALKRKVGALTLYTDVEKDQWWTRPNDGTTSKREHCCLLIKTCTEKYSADAVALQWTYFQTGALVETETEKATDASSDADASSTTAAPTSDDDTTEILGMAWWVFVLVCFAAVVIMAGIYHAMLKEHQKYADHFGGGGYGWGGGKGMGMKGGGMTVRRQKGYGKGPVVPYASQW